MKKIKKLYVEFNLLKKEIEMIKLDYSKVNYSSINELNYKFIKLKKELLKINEDNLEKIKDITCYISIKHELEIIEELNIPRLYSEYLHLEKIKEIDKVIKKIDEEDFFSEDTIKELEKEE